MKPHIKRVPFYRRTAVGVWSREARAYVYPPADNHLWGVYLSRESAKPVALAASFDTLRTVRVFTPRAGRHGGARA